MTTNEQLVADDAGRMTREVTLHEVAESPTPPQPHRYRGGVGNRSRGFAAGVGWSSEASVGVRSEVEPGPTWGPLASASVGRGGPPVGRRRGRRPRATTPDRLRGARATPVGAGFRRRRWAVGVVGAQRNQK